MEAEQASGAAAIIVLDGGANHLTIGELAADVAAPATVFRAFEAVRLLRSLPGVPIVVSAGSYGDDLERGREGAAMRDELLRQGVPAGRIVMDLDSPNTAASAQFVKQWLQERRASRFVLVTSAAHVRRARLAFLAAGLDPIVSPAPMRSNPVHNYLTPDAESIAISRQVIYDVLGLGYYFLRGWV